MVFADAKDVQSHLIGVFDLLDEVAQTVLRAHGQTVVVESGCEAVNADLHQAASLAADVGAAGFDGDSIGLKGRVPIRLSEWPM